MDQTEFFPRLTPTLDISTQDPFTPDINSIRARFQDCRNNEDRAKLYFEMVPLRSLITKPDNLQFFDTTLRQLYDAVTAHSRKLQEDLQILSCMESSSFSESDNHISEEDSDYKTVQKRKSFRQYSSSFRPSSQKKRKSEATRVDNRFQSIAPDDDDTDMSEVDELVEKALRDAEINPSPPASPSVSKTTAHAHKVTSSVPAQKSLNYVPPIVIDNPQNASALLKEFATACEAKIMGKFLSGNKLKVFPTTSDQHRKVQKLISDKQLKSFTFELPEQQQLKVVIRGLPPNEDIKDIELELIKHGLQPTNIAPMRHRMSGNSMPLYLVLLSKVNHNVADIYKIDTIGSYKVSFEPLRRKGIPGQCFNCQEFWHSSRFCTRDAVCVKCAGPHESKSCTKPKDTPAKCGNCSGDHTANFSGCPQNPRNRVKYFPPAPDADDFPQLNTKVSKNAVPAISVAWNNRDKLARVKAPPTAPLQAKRLVPRPHIHNLYMHSSHREF
ncbi:Nucleic-acid-binding protein from transposon X-element [Araneus ventricosus]|uniref:Nucleic-acid-binding protein from transposon X-element n=1 Tax=Araneus ventricosus TaxID=182803 RepID=A0A4Y2U7Z9_ARAVE|nr:Nucleic-acid-binding protein from transposon X-element [Araneus ventricosus]